jgi:hypothetical protein
VTLVPGKYRVAVYNGAASPAASWGAKDLNYWDVGLGSSGITAGPLFAPPLASASQCWEYNSSDGGATPPFSNGTQEAGQSPFSQTVGAGSATNPNLYVDGLAQNYYVDMEVTPPPYVPPSSGGLLMACCP